MVFFRIEFLNFPTAKYQKEGSCQSVDPGRNVKHDLPSEKYLLFKFNSVKTQQTTCQLKSPDQRETRQGSLSLQVKEALNNRQFHVALQ